LLTDKAKPFARMGQKVTGLARTGWTAVSEKTIGESMPGSSRIFDNLDISEPYTMKGIMV
jgi:hypothetical protein